MTDYISRADAIDAVIALRHKAELSDYNFALGLAEDAIRHLPSADAKPTVIRSRTLLPTKDFKEWAKRIRETNPNAVVIPCDAEVVSAVPQLKQTDTLIIADALRYLAKDTERHLSDRTRADSLRQQFLKYGASMSADAVQGEWIWRTDIPIGGGRTSAGYICSNCGKDYWHGNVFNFCPSCGARMKGGADE